MLQGREVVVLLGLDEVAVVGGQRLGLPRRLHLLVGESTCVVDRCASPCAIREGSGQVGMSRGMSRGSGGRVRGWTWCGCCVSL